MFHKLQKIHDEVKKEFKHSATNVTGASATATADFLFMRFIRTQTTKPIITSLKERKSTFIEVSNAETAIIAIFAHAYHLGNCGEQTSVVFIKLLEDGISESIEIMNMEGTYLKGGYTLEREGKSIAYEYKTHAVVASGRDLISSNLQDASTWKNASISDTWTEGFLHQGKISTKLKETDLTRGFFRLKRITSEPRMDKNLNDTEWYNIANLLRQSKKYLNVNFKKFAAEHKREVADLDAEVVKINFEFDRKIKSYTNKGFHTVVDKSFMIKHFLNKTDTLFRTETRGSASSCPTAQIRKLARLVKK